MLRKRDTGFRLRLDASRYFARPPRAVGVQSQIEEGQAGHLAGLLSHSEVCLPEIQLISFPDVRAVQVHVSFDHVLILVLWL